MGSDGFRLVQMGSDGVRWVQMGLDDFKWVQMECVQIGSGGFR